ncbi:hypothetical protein AHOG_21090 [Actinoalloteichus hoggarensis]|uniref:Uncharacterized protein n=1 Tax=Actinoalloteichus hoggarensis TaxID=1470176 RepID=A0A221W7V1_9PSEU|nr:hypothetical protein AHOG_21090 [Actinoalloteichus hoggarensis]
MWSSTSQPAASRSGHGRARPPMGCPVRRMVRDPDSDQDRRPLIDWDGTCRGPRELNLGTGVSDHLPEPEADGSRFLTVYGYDKPGRPLSPDITEPHTLGASIRLTLGRPAALTESRHHVRPSTAPVTGRTAGPPFPEAAPVLPGGESTVSARPGVGEHRGAASARRRCDAVGVRGLRSFLERRRAGPSRRVSPRVRAGRRRPCHSASSAAWMRSSTAGASTAVAMRTARRFGPGSTSVV